MKPILCIEFDGVICSNDVPVPGVFEFINSATESFDVHVYSSRSGKNSGIRDMKKWLCRRWAEWLGDNGTLEIQIRRNFSKAAVGVVYKKIKWPTGKPPAIVTIDARSLTFTGVWPDIDALKSFNPWTPT